MAAQNPKGAYDALYYNSVESLRRAAKQDLVRMDEAMVILVENAARNPEAGDDADRAARLKRVQAEFSRKYPEQIRFLRDRDAAKADLGKALPMEFELWDAMLQLPAADAATLLRRINQGSK